jgi:hypothetical protein
MARWSAALDEWLRTHHGVVGAPTLAQIGVPPRSVTRLLERQQLIPIFPGVYRSRQWPFDDVQRMVAVCVRNRAAMIGFTTAAREWAFRKIDDRDLHALVHHGRSPQLGGVIVHRCRRIDPVDVVERPDGLRLTSPPRTLFDIADMVGFKAASSITEQVIDSGMCTIGTITDTVIRLAHPNRPGSRTMQQVLAARPAWSQALQSDLEFRVYDEIRRQRLPTPVAQCPVSMPSGRIVHIDLGWPEFQVGLEVDHPAWHNGTVPRHRDIRRDRGAAVAGWFIPRVSQFEVDTGLAGAIAEVGVILRRRGWTI